MSAVAPLRSQRQRGRFTSALLLLSLLRPVEAAAAGVRPLPRPQQQPLGLPPPLPASEEAAGLPPVVAAGAAGLPPLLPAAAAGAGAAAAARVEAKPADEALRLSAADRTAADLAAALAAFPGPAPERRPRLQEAPFAVGPSDAVAADTAAAMQLRPRPVRPALEVEDSHPLAQLQLQRPQPLPQSAQEAPERHLPQNLRHQNTTSMLQTRRSSSEVSTGGLVCLLLMLVLICGTVLLIMTVRKRQATRKESPHGEPFEDTPEGGGYLVNGRRPELPSRLRMEGLSGNVLKAQEGEKIMGGSPAQAEPRSNDIFVAQAYRRFGSNTSVATPNFRPPSSREALAEPLAPTPAARTPIGSVRQLSARSTERTPSSSPIFRADDEEIVQFSPGRHAAARPVYASPARPHPDY